MVGVHHQNHLQAGPGQQLQQAFVDPIWQNDWQPCMDPCTADVGNFLQQSQQTGQIGVAER